MRFTIVPFIGAFDAVRERVGRTQVQSDRPVPAIASLHTEPADLEGRYKIAEAAIFERAMQNVT